MTKPNTDLTAVPPLTGVVYMPDEDASAQVPGDVVTFVHGPDPKNVWAFVVPYSLKHQAKWLFGDECAWFADKIEEFVQRHAEEPTKQRQI